jgi:hypothetical protein
VTLSSMTFVSPIAFELPNWRPDGAWTEHGPFAAWLMEQTKPRVLVELGSAGGYSMAAFCQAIKTLGLETKVIAVDTWAGDEHGGFYSEQLHSRLKTHVAANYAGFAEMRRMTFAEALPTVADGSVDVLHVDGRHFYDDVKEDFTTWIPKLSDRAVVLFHDTQVRDRGFGVLQYWAELERDFPTFEFHHGNGLGVLCHGHNAPAALKALCALDKTALVAREVRNAYERLGMGVEGLRTREKREAEKAERRALRKAPHVAVMRAIKSSLGR